MEPKEFLTELELLLDKTSVQDIVQGLIEICHEKSQHLRENWGDVEGAKQWDKQAMKLEKVITKI